MDYFWLSPYQWPRDPSGFVFLARAVHEIGRTNMKDEWTGSEPTTEHIPRLPTNFGLGQYPPAPHHLERAHRLLMKHRPEFNRTPLEWGKWGPPSITFSNEEWEAAVELSKDEERRTLPYAQRFRTVQSEIVRQCEAGDLASFYRWDTTGQMLPIPREWWNTDRWQPRFAMCRINPRDPMSIGIAGDNFCWIFLQRSSLDLFLASRRSDSVQVESNISAQTKCMKWLCEQMQLNEKPIKLKAEYWEEAKDRFRVGRNAFDRAWGDAVQQTGRAAYSARGRRPARNG
jgi:hypothetical protein